MVSLPRNMPLGTRYHTQIAPQLPKYCACECQIRRLGVETCQHYQLGLFTSMHFHSSVRILIS